MPRAMPMSMCGPTGSWAAALAKTEPIAAPEKKNIQIKAGKQKKEQTRKTQVINSTYSYVRDGRGRGRESPSPTLHVMSNISIPG